MQRSFTFILTISMSYQGICLNNQFYYKFALKYRIFASLICIHACTFIKPPFGPPLYFLCGLFDFFSAWMHQYYQGGQNKTFWRISLKQIKNDVRWTSSYVIFNLYAYKLFSDIHYVAVSQLTRTLWMPKFHINNHINQNRKDLFKQNMFTFIQLLSKDIKHVLFLRWSILDM